VDCEFLATLAQGFGHALQFVDLKITIEGTYHDEAFDLILLDVINLFSGYCQDSFLHPVKHVYLANLVRKEQSF